MRTTLLTILVFGFGLVPGQSAPAQEEFKAIIAKAVKAHGGAEKLAAVEKKGIELKSKGVIHLMGVITYTGESFVQMPGKFREVLQMDINGTPVTQTVVLNDGKCWINVNGMNVDLGDTLTKEMKEEMHARRAMSLLPLLNTKDFELAALGETKVGDDEAIGIKVSAKDRRDLGLFFSKKSGLLVKVESRAFDFHNQQEVAQEIFLSDYQAEDGYQIPRRMLLNREGKKFLEREVTEVRFVDKIDDGVFAKP